MTSIYDKNLNEMHSMTLGKHRNPFLSGAPSRNTLGELIGVPDLDAIRSLGLGAFSGSNFLPDPNPRPLP